MRPRTFKFWLTVVLLALLLTVILVCIIGCTSKSVATSNLMNPLCPSIPLFIKYGNGAALMCSDCHTNVCIDTASDVGIVVRVGPLMRGK